MYDIDVTFEEYNFILSFINNFRFDLPSFKSLDLQVFLILMKYLKYSK